MDDLADIELVTKNLTAAGLRVNRISVDPKGVERCDLSACDSAEEYLIEVKGINDEEELKETLKKGEIYQTDRLHVYRKRVDKEIRKASSQLHATAQVYPDHLHLVALIARSSYDAPFMAEQILGTLYGVGAITDDSSGEARRRRCLYFSESAFYRHSDLDGALVLSSGGIALYMNDHGRRRERMRRCSLARFLSQYEAFYDQDAMEVRCDCLVADFALDRSNRAGVLDRIRRKYANPNFQILEWHRWEGLA